MWLSKDERRVSDEGEESKAKRSRGRDALLFGRPRRVGPLTTRLRYEGMHNEVFRSGAVVWQPGSSCAPCGKRSKGRTDRSPARFRAGCTPQNDLRGLQSARSNDRRQRSYDSRVARPEDGRVDEGMHSSRRGRVKGSCTSCTRWFGLNWRFRRCPHASHVPSPSRWVVRCSRLRSSDEEQGTGLKHAGASGPVAPSLARVRADSVGQRDPSAGDGKLAQSNASLSPSHHRQQHYSTRFCRLDTLCQALDSHALPARRAIPHPAVSSPRIVCTRRAMPGDSGAFLHARLSTE